LSDPLSTLEPSLQLTQYGEKKDYWQQGRYTTVISSAKEGLGKEKQTEIFIKSQKWWNQSEE
jgi:hypothetical protein